MYINEIGLMSCTYEERGRHMRREEKRGEERK
jgi:hypothetical protein